MDVLPAHLNRDSFRDSFKGLVALEIIIDLPIGFPINNIISQRKATADEPAFFTWQGFFALWNQLRPGLDGGW